MYEKPFVIQSTIIDSTLIIMTKIIISHLNFKLLSTTK